MLQHHSGSKQRKPNAYKSQMDGGYGALMVELSKRVDKMVLHICKGGNLLYNRCW